MFISIPKEFFVPVLFSGDFKLNNENNNMEYNYERKNVEYNEVLFNNVSRDYLSDTINLDKYEELRHDEEFTKSNFDNIKDKEIEEQIIKYIYGFMRFIKELKEANCLGNNEKESTNLVNNYARKLKDVYNMYKNEVLRVRRPLTPGDIDAFIDYYIEKISDIYNKNLAELNCKTLNYDTIEAVIDDILNDARNILREQIENLNCMLVNRRVECKSEADLNNSFKNSANLYNKIDNEFVNSTLKM